MQRLAARSGGAERVLIELANHLATKGWQVQIISYESRGKPPFYPLRFGVAHFNLKCPVQARSHLRRMIDRVRSLLQDVRFYVFPIDHLLWLNAHGGFERALARHLRLHRPDIAVAFMPPAIVALGRARVDHPLRRVASVHNVPERDFADPGRWDPNPLDRKRRLLALRRCAAITHSLPEFREWYPEDLRERVVIIPNPVPPVDAKQRARAQRGKTVMAVGRLAAVKRHDLLLESWARLGDEFPDWHLEIYGTGPDQEDLERRLHDLGLEGRARLMGHVRDIGERHLRAAILAHPARHEGWGLAVTEALAAGTPAIGFADCQGVNQLIRHGVNGLLVAPDGDRVADFAAALAELMRDDARRAALGAAGPDSVAAFAPEKVFARWEAAVLGEPLLDDGGPIAAWPIASCGEPVTDEHPQRDQRRQPERISNAAQ